MKQKTIPMHMEMNAHNLLLTILSVFFLSCGTPKKNIGKIQEDVYEIIEKVNYGKDGLYYRTLSYEELPAPHLFSYDKINEGNVKYNSITEKGRFVNFDTIFNQEQRQEIDDHIKNLKSIKLHRPQLTDPKILSRERTPYVTPMTEQKGRNSVTFPFIVDSVQGDKYGFIFRSSSGLLHIYKKEENDWKEFARLEIQIL